MKFWLKQNFVAVDQLLNAILGGYADETISSRAHRDALAGKPLAASLINKLFFWQSNHCRGAFRDEAERRQLPPEFRGPAL